MVILRSMKCASKFVFHKDVELTVSRESVENSCSGASKEKMHGM